MLKREPFVRDTLFHFSLSLKRNSRFPRFSQGPTWSTTSYNENRPWTSYSSWICMVLFRLLLQPSYERVKTVGHRILPSKAQVTRGPCRLSYTNKFFLVPSVTTRRRYIYCRSQGWRPSKSRTVLVKVDTDDLWISVSLNLSLVTES